MELDRLDGGPSALSRLPGVVSAKAAATDGGPVDRQTVEVNLVLEDDGALGAVVGALGGLGSHILALRKSEPSLEDVFVELVGRGFDEEAGPDDPAPPAGDRRSDDTATTDDEEAAEVA
jgi:ABC-2 type transport system ATP-binding protein